MFAIMAMAGCIDKETELEIYPIENTLKKVRDRCRYHGERPLISSHKEDNLLTDKLTVEGRNWVKERMPQTYEQIFEDAAKGKEDKKTRKRMVKKARTLVNMYLADIAYIVDEKPKLGELKSGNTDQEPAIWDKLYGCAFYNSLESKRIFIRESHSSRSTGILLSQWRVLEYDYTAKVERGEDLFLSERIEREAYVVYNLMETNGQVFEKVEKRYRKETEILRDMGTGRNKGEAKEIIFGNNYDLVYHIIRNSFHGTREEEERRKQIMKKRWEKENPGKTFDEKAEIYNTGDMTGIRYRAQTYYVVNGREGSVCLKLLANRGTMEMLYDVILKNDGIVASGRANVEDGWIYSEADRSVLERKVYFLFPLQIAKLNMVALDRQKAKLYVLSSQEHFVREFLNREEKDICNSASQIWIEIYDDGKVKEIIKQYQNVYGGNQYKWK